MSECLQAALDRKNNAESEVFKILKRDYPPGTPINWERGGSHTGVVVTNTDYGGRIKVRNIETEKEYWIYASDIV